MTGEKSGEFRGKSVEAAITAGLAALRLSREEVEVEVVRPGSRGVLGIGAEDAVVRLTAIPRGSGRSESRSAQAETRPQAATPGATPSAAPSATPTAVPSTPRPERQEPRPAQPTRSEPKAPATPSGAPAEAAAGTAEERATAAAEKGRELLLGMLERMGMDADVEITEQSDAEVDEDDRALVLNIVGDELGVLIGRQNETLSALEFVTRLMVNQQVRTRTNFVVDVNGYRSKRAESLRKLALRMAEQVAESGRTVALEPMPPAERRIIHLALRDHPTVGTQSVGEGDRRKVTLVPKK